MKGSVAVVKMLSVVCVLLLAQGQSLFAQDGASTQLTKTIVGDLLDVDRDFYIVRGELGEIQIEATHKTEITEEFQYGDRIKALVLMNNKALKIERAGPDDVSGVVEHVAPTAKASTAPKAEEGKASEAAPPPRQPDRKMIVADLLDVDRDFYIVRGELGEIQIEATHKTEITEEFQYGDRIKALVLMNNKALKIERAGPDDVSGMVEHVASSSPSAAQGAGTKVVEGQVLMVDGDFYVLRGELGEIRVERTPKTKMTEEFKFGDFIKATLKPNDQALTIERLAP